MPPLPNLKISPIGNSVKFKILMSAIKKPNFLETGFSFNNKKIPYFFIISTCKTEPWQPSISVRTRSGS